ncbi:MAG: hypothetical protein OEW15_03570 [Nitrospirota bacterium]|nr:hypothetical protein [Nitrospirota bacterium]
MPTNFAVIEGKAANPGVLYGKVVDYSTRAGVANATVYLKVSGEWRQVNTKTATTTGAENVAGDFTINNLPLASCMQMVIKTPQGASYVTYKDDCVWIDQQGNYENQSNWEVAYDYGNVEMVTGVNFSVYVVNTDTGNYVTKSDGSALAIYNGWWTDTLADEMATRDTTDTNKYTIIVPQTFANFQLCTPAVDTTGDGIFDVTSGCALVANYNSSMLTNEGTLNTNILVSNINTYTAVAKVADNMAPKGANAGGTTLDVLAKTDNMKIFFNQPVEIASGGNSLRLNYTDNLKTLTANAVVTELTATIALSSSNTLMTITPSAAFIENETYTYDADSVSLRAQSATNGNQDTVYSLANLMGTNGSFYIYATGNGTMGSTPALSVDNANFCNNNTAITTGDPVVCAAAAPMLVFPENVWGTVSLISRQSGTTTVTYVNNAPAAITGQGAISYLVTQASTSTAFTGNTYGYKATGSAFLFNLNTALGTGAIADNTTAAPQTLNLEINAYDAEGNVYHQVGSFAVQ